MCGIAGIVLPSGVVPDRRVLTEMTDRIAHRGPDADGVWTSPGVGFGHRRLSILDLSPAGAQPMVTPDGGAAICFNGEVYNFADVRPALEAEGFQFRSRSDTEVLLYALRRWGEDALTRLHGMFAFAYWDVARRTLLLARDRFGKKPLYYAPLGDARGTGGIVFASELRAMLAHPRVWAERAVDPAAVAQYLLHESVPQPLSILKNVRKLGPGEKLAWDETRGLRIDRYYTPRFSTRIHGDERELADELTRRVERAVDTRLVADVPVGIFLSGGLDSSFVAACAVKKHPRVKTFAIGFEDPSFDESEHAALVAKHLGTEHYTEVLSPNAMLDLLPSTLDWVDEPHADTSILPTTLLARMARREVVVALGGDGGDELLAGYPTFVADQVTGWLPAFPPPLFQAMIKAARRFPSSDRNFSLSFMLRQASHGYGARGAARHARWLGSFLPEEMPSLLGPAMRSGAGHALDAVHASVTDARGRFEEATAYYLRVYLGEGVLQKVDRATMRVSLEARAPLLDTDVVEFCLALAPEYRVRGRTTKWIMRKALEPMVPRSITERPKKGFGAPVGAWLRGPLRDMLRDTLDPRSLRDVGWLEPGPVSDMVEAHLAGRADLRKPLFTLLVLEHWRRTWFAQARPAAGAATERASTAA